MYCKVLCVVLSLQMDFQFHLEKINGGDLKFMEHIKNTQYGQSREYSSPDA